MRYSGSHQKGLDLDDVLSEALQISGKVSKVTLARMSSAVRYSPTSYEAGVREILALYEREHVISIDLSSMHADDAVKLVTYCSGVIGVSRGGMFRLATQVVMLIPPSE